MPTLTTPTKNIAELAQQQRHFWLPNELIYELLRFVRPSSFWTVRRMLMASAILFRLVTRGKHAKTWRHSFGVLDRELSFAAHTFGPQSKRAMLCRNHAIHLPSFDDIPDYMEYSATHKTFYILILLDDKKFSSAEKAKNARSLLEEHISGAKDALKKNDMKAFSDDGGLVRFRMLDLDNTEFDVCKVKFKSDVGLNKFSNALEHFLVHIRDLIDDELPKMEI
ncbi:hypothetical protein niasHT_031619 [Heterodera trifolii]|uniref:Uncharacterized protein n=1 Tax=Heterodera trifolii TaxID=157864 RepID=A0ABD2IXU2_9BILA